MQNNLIRMEKQKGFIHFFNGDIVFLMACLTFSLLMLIQTGKLRDESAILVPRLFGILAIILALSAILIRAIVFLREGKKSKKEIASVKLTKPEGAMSLYTAIALSIIYLILTELIGFIIGTIVIILAFLWFADYRRISVGLIYSIITSFVLYFLFYSILKVNLPRGIIF